MNKTSPMMEQYKAIKEQHPDKLLLFQVGDFYELFYEDARTASLEMEIALTSRDAGSENPIPLAGVPIHAAETYLNKLLAKGHKVVICDQVEDASQAKGLVRREITRILTPGTITNPELLDESRNNYLAVIVDRYNADYYGLACVDISTGDFKVTEQKGEDAWNIIADELRRLQPSEILCASPELIKLCQNQLKFNGTAIIDLVPYLPDHSEYKRLLTGQWGESTWDTLQMDNYPLAGAAAGATLSYLQILKQLSAGKNVFHQLDLYFSKRNMLIDTITIRNLELTQSLREGGKQGSLISILDRCMTGMGKRLLRRRLEQPLIAISKINERLTAVEELFQKPLKRRDMQSKLREIIDLERFCSKLSYQKINARDLVSLKNTLRQIAPLKQVLAELNSEYINSINNKLPSFDNLIELIDSSLIDDPPLSLKEGGLFKAGYDSDIDNLTKLSREGSSMLLEFENKERSRTGIKSLRVGYNRNFGYYIEATRSNLDLVPPDYHRKQTLINAERFTTDELRVLEEQITGARDKLAILEYNRFEELRSQVMGFSAIMLAAAHELASIDCIQSLAEIAERNNYCRPVFSDEKKLSVKQVRHPMVEQISTERFVPNDLVMDNNHYILLITGPNMAGKSTYIRSAALISIMAQMGSFVPAEKAVLPIFDRIFARVGASDDLSRGHSTFMVEMQETAAILKESTIDSLVILDEIGRGTSTYDGMSIARSVIEYISRKIKAKTLFSTHYHELTNLEGDLRGIKNYTMAVKEKNKQVIFLRQIIPGRSDKSYGINVARLAGVPLEVLIRAETILAELEMAASSAAEQQLSLLPMVTEPVNDHEAELEVIENLKELDLNRLTPLEAIQALYEFQNKLIIIERLRDEGEEADD